jgi:hypothetical protein
LAAGVLVAGLVVDTEVIGRGVPEADFGPVNALVVAKVNQIVQTAIIPALDRPVRP